MFEEVLPYVAWSLSRYEAYGLFFLLGSFVVASVSDIKHLSAQREFMDVWWAFAVLLFILQWGLSDWSPSGPLILKWVLVVVFAIVSHSIVGWWLRVATADVAAIVAATMLLPPGLVILFMLGLKLLSYPAAWLLARGKNAYPFLPVVTIVTVLFVAGAFWAGIVD